MKSPYRVVGVGPPPGNLEEFEVGDTDEEDGEDEDDGGMKTEGRNIDPIEGGSTAIGIFIY